jgi:hypothetical protein
VGQVGGGSKAVAVHGRYAYLNVGPRLVVLDVADLAHPTVVGQSPPLPGFESVAVAESHAYVAGEGGLHVIDVSDPVAPTAVGLYATTGSAWSVAVMNTTVYLATGGGLHIVDISNPVAPAGIGFYDTPDTALDVTVVGDVAYVAEAYSENDDPTERGGLRIVDVSDPANPSEIGYYPLYPRQSGYNRIYEPRGTRAVAVAGDYACLIYGAPKSKGGLRILDISAPGNPTEIGDYQDYIALVSDVAVVGDPTGGSESVYAYLATGVNYGLVTLDVSDPAQPVSLDTRVPEMTLGIAVTGNTLFATDALGGLHIADISDPAHAFEIGAFETPG